MTRLLVVGLDGATDAVLGLPDARLEHLDAIRRDGAAGTLRSTVPPITAAAWASMMTGWNPGRHGMYDFRTLAIDRYTRLWGAGHSDAFGDGHEFVTSRRWAGAAFWDRLGPEQRVAVLSVPMTYPAWSVNGVMVSGFPLPDYGRSHTAPAELAAELPPLLEGADRLASLDDAELADLCRRLVDRQAAIAADWIDHGDYDVVVVVFQGTDFAQHRLWKYLDDPAHPLRERLLDMYRSIDAFVGRARDRMGPSGTVAVVSDHGFGPHPGTFVHTDRVLADAGLLALPGGARGSVGQRAARLLGRAPAVRRAVRRTLGRLPGRARDWAAGQATGASRVDWGQTLAYRIPLYAPAEGVVVNLKGRQEHGAVAPGAEYEAVRDRVIALLEGLTDPATGRPVVLWAKRREDVFTGEYLEEAPDVVCLFDPAYKGAAGIDAAFEPVPQSVLEAYSGVHAMEGVVALAGAGVRAGVDLGTRDIVDVAPTLLALLGAPVPADVDGAVMEAALREPATVAATGAATTAPARAADEPALSPEEEATLEASLRSLGYIE
jgi:predicted AlkP superfamily phosphohydrolase/phosphomutase